MSCQRAAVRCSLRVGRGIGNELRSHEHDLRYAHHVELRGMLRSVAEQTLQVEVDGAERDVWVSTKNGTLAPNLASPLKERILVGGSMAAAASSVNSDTTIASTQGPPSAGSSTADSPSTSAQKLELLLDPDLIVRRGGNRLAYPHRTGFRPVSDQCCHVTMSCHRVMSRRMHMTWPGLDRTSS